MTPPVVVRLQIVVFAFDFFRTLIFRPSGPFYEPLGGPKICPCGLDAALALRVILMHADEAFCQTFHDFSEPLYFLLKSYYQFLEYSS